MTSRSEPLHNGVEDLTDPGRLAALRATDSRAKSEDAFDRFARLVRTILGVPVGLVSLVDDAHQYFPGASSKDECGARQTPLGHSLGRIVAATGDPLVIADARADPRVAGHLAITELGVIAYAGVPLVAADGQVLGSLCAIDHEPRHWTATEVGLLNDLAWACASDLRRRISARDAASVDAAQTDLQAQLSAALRNSRILLDASESFAAAASLPEVVEAVSHLISTGQPPVFAGMGLIEDAGPSMRMLMAPSSTALLDARWDQAGLPPADCIQTRKPKWYADRAAVLDDYPGLGDELHRLGWHALVCVPLLGAQAPLGVLMFAWSEPHELNVLERATMTALAGYVTQAVARLLFLRERMHVAEILQRAMLTDLPSVPRLDLAARYQPAHDGDQVGGDWYDAFTLPGGDVMLVIGDVAGHDMTAATTMGQMRSTLRALAIDREPTPAELIKRLEAAASALSIDTVASMIVVRLTAGANGYDMTWANAGHPPPLRHDEHGIHALAERDPIIGLRHTHRRDHRARLRVGDTLVLYTDGLVEAREQDLTTRIDTLIEAIDAEVQLPPGPLLDAIIGRMSGGGLVDDIAALACRVRAA